MFSDYRLAEVGIVQYLWRMDLTVSRDRRYMNFRRKTRFSAHELVDITDEYKILKQLYDGDNASTMLYRPDYHYLHAGDSSLSNFAVSSLPNFSFPIISQSPFLLFTSITLQCGLFSSRNHLKSST